MKNTQTKLIRNFEQVLDDYLYPRTGGLSDIDPPESKRHKAIEEVLCRIPQPDYDKLKNLVESFYYFIPHVKSRGEVYPFPVTVDSQEIEGTTLKRKAYSKVLYFSPMLENIDYDIVLAVIAHEYAHIVLNHDVYAKGSKYGQQEDEAWNLICKWKFDKENRKRQIEQQARDKKS